MDATEHRRLYYLAAAASVAFLLLPLLSFEVPPLVDYPNHLARIHILAQYDANPAFRSAYELILEPLPNLAMDMVATPVARLFGAYAASRVFLATVLIAYCWGCHLLGQAGLGRPNWLAIPCFFTFYSSALLWGFVNYVTGVAVFLLAYVWWLRTLDRPGLSRHATTALLALCSYLAHLSSYAFLCLASGLTVLMRLRSRQLTWRTAAFALAPLGAPALLFLLLRTGSERVDSWGFVWNSPVEKIPGLLNLVRTYDLRFDAGLLAVLALLGVAAIWLLRPSLRQEFAVIGLAFFALFLIAPRDMFANSASGVDVRFIVPSALLLLLGVRFTRDHSARLLLLAAITILSVRVGFIWHSWHDLAAPIDVVRNIVEDVPAGSRLCVIHAGRPGRDEQKHDSAISHFYCLAVIDRSIAVSQLFTDPGAQPIVFRDAPPLRSRAAHLIKANDLDDPAWWDYFEYFLTFREPAGMTGKLEQRAEKVRETGPYRLWRNRRLPPAERGPLAHRPIASATRSPSRNRAGGR
jgi:hypothetical protein